MPVIKLEEEPGEYAMEAEVDGQRVPIRINVLEVSYALEQMGVGDNGTLAQVVAAVRKVGRPAETFAKLSDSQVFAKATSAGLVFDASGKA